MQCSRKVKYNLVLSVFFLLLLIVGIGSYFSPVTFSNFQIIENVWSGEIATSFSGGNGTEENPYQISNGEELAYFKEVVESTNDYLYLDKYYVLTSNINMGNLSLEPINATFKGSIDGQGYTINNLKIDNIINNDNKLYIGIFTNLNNANIKNINLNNISIEIEEESNLYVGIISSKMYKTTLKNISLSNSTITITNKNNKENIYVGGISGYEENSSLTNSYINVDINYTNENSNIGNIYGYSNSNKNVTNIIIDSNIENISNQKNYKEIYTKEEVTDKYLEELNKDLEDKDYYWTKDEERYYLHKNIIILKEESNNISDTLASITVHDSGIFDNIVYVNDLDADYYYYMGLNYTTNTSGTLPTMENKNLYNDTNLIKVKITYNGKTIQSGQEITGTVSPTELQDTYIYFKTYPVNNNGTTDIKTDDYITIELIDNPFTNRPGTYGFNGWFTNYSKAEISFDSDIYVRYAKVPVTYTDNKPDDIVIDFTAKWTGADIYEVNTNNTNQLTTAINGFNDTSMQQLETKIEVDRIETPIYGELTDIDMSGYFEYSSIGFFEQYPSNTYDADGNPLTGRCWGTCYGYFIINSDTYNPNQTYYELTDSGMVELDESTLEVPIIDYDVEIIYGDIFDASDNMSTYFEQVTIARNDSYAGYYNASGVYQESGTCNTTGGCTYYKLLQYYDENDVANTYDTNKIYYYLVTRDTNIIVLNTNLTGSWGANQTKPLTITGAFYGELNNVTWNVSNTYVRAGNDLVVENMTIDSNSNRAETTPNNGTGNNTTGYFYGSWFNVKIGRGITRNGSESNFLVAMGGNNTATGSSSSITEYRFIVESGYYNALSVTGGNRSRSNYINGEAIYGNDYDRVDENNDNLDIYFCASGSWGNNIYKSGATSIAMHTRVKSGRFGSARPTNTNSNDSAYSYGIYVGGRQGGENYTAREGIIEGGWVYNLIGGPLAQSGNANYNDSYIYVTGGEVDVIIGGAGRTTTYGNRIIQVTGGTINHSIFGGSNGITSSTSGDQAGALDGTSYIYVGGNAQIGSETNVTNNVTLFGFEAGSVFGIGNGQSGTGTIGTADNSYIIIDEQATILRNVYGGGNYGAVGINSSDSTSKTQIDILGGTVNGSIFGGGNRNGSGSTSKTATITINQTGGTVKGSIYGGSNEEGIIYGGVNINGLGGTVENDIYGGGYGGLSDTSDGTYVRDAVNIIIGDTTDDIVPTINGSVYGGSAFGTVNGATNTNTVSSNGVQVTVNEGIIKTSVFGGGKGNSTYTPRVLGNIVVTINGGNIADVFGGNDAAGTPNGSVTIYLNGGTIGRTFGGGNNASVTSNTIYLQGANSTNIFGGSNASGTVTTSNIIATSGTTDTIYGGNNTDGNTVTSNITIYGGTITTAVYGGGNLATTDTTNIALYGSSIPNVYGGGANADITTSSNIDLKGSTVTNLFGGSNAGGNVTESNIKIYTGNATNVFGGNNEAGKTTTTHIDMINGDVGNIYGGGNKVGVDTSNINLVGGTIENVYGGSNQAGDVINANILTPDASSFIKNGLSMSVTSSNGWDVEPYDSMTKINVSLTNSTSNPVTSYLAVIKTTDSELLYDWSQSTVKGQGNTYTFDHVNKWNAQTPNTVGANGTYSIEFYTGNFTPLDEFEILDYYVFGTTDSGDEYMSITPSELVVGNVYGGNNLGGTTTTPIVNLTKGTYDNVYGGGNQAVTNGNATTTLTNVIVNNSVYGGGNQAAVLGNTTINVNGTTNVNKNVFGGGNHGAVGSTSTDNSISTVNIAGATIGGNVYGGCNTSVVQGTAKVNIGKNAITNTNAVIGDIKIAGTVFGGGEANESGSETYDFEFISVTQGIDIMINGTEYNENDLEFVISGSIFGSGNASTSAGPSNIYILKLGTRENPNTSISIQRTDLVTIDDSTIELIGTTDRTNEYSNIKYSLNRIKKLKLKNNATLLLRKNANMLEEFASLVDIDGEEIKAKVEIDVENKTVTKNVDNRLYLLAGENLNVTTNEQATSYGKVSGMTFLGMYQKYGSYVYGLYDYDKGFDSETSANDVIANGSYVLGLHHLNHDITIDGYYTNYIDDEYTELTVDYVVPTPPDSNYYMWTIGTASINYSFNLTASKYSSLGTYELSMKDFSKGNTIFNVIGFNGDGLKQGIVLKDSSEVPKLAATKEEANSVIGLAMKTETTEWTKHGVTKFYRNPDNEYVGDIRYSTDNQTIAPSLMFYLYHAKNIAADEELGTVVITLQSLEPKNEVEYDTKLITITVNIDTKDYDDEDAYDASITYSKKYEMPSATVVNITNKSQFTAYFALFAEPDVDVPFYGINNDYYRALVSNYVLPVGTQITMIDYGANEINPNYYYYTVTQTNYQEKLNQFDTENEVSYLLSDFIKMDSIDSNNTYSDSESSNLYYHENINYIMEEYIFIFDFKDTENVGEQQDKQILFELRNNEDRTIISVLGIRQDLMKYNLFETSNVVLSETITIDNNYLYYNMPKNVSYHTSIGYNQTENRESIIDTNYESSSMGINVTLYDSTGTQVSSSLLSSTTITIDSTTYYVDSNGVFRIKLSDKVSNLTKNMILNTGLSLPTGTYTMKVSLFASNDGLHDSSDKEPTIEEIQIIVIGNDNLIIVDTDDTSKLVIGETGLNMADSKEEKFTIKYSSVLENPNIRVSVYKRDITSSTSNEYVECEGMKIFANSFSYPPLPLSAQTTHEYIVTTTPTDNMEVIYTLKDELESGTYKIVFKLYDNNQLIDEDYEYIIIRKNV